jgi:class 3 adenylate cyclase
MLPPIPPRGVAVRGVASAVNSGTQVLDEVDATVDEEKDIMCAQVAELVFKKEHDRLELARLTALVETYQQQAAAGGVDGTLTMSSPQRKERVSSAGPLSPRRRYEANHTTALVVASPVKGGAVLSSGAASFSSMSTSLPTEDALLVAQLQLLRLQTQNETLIASSEAVRDECRRLNDVYEEKLREAHASASLQANVIEQLTSEKRKLNSRVADDILLQSQRNRIEMAARRIAAPKVARQSGLRRIEACERNALAAHDDLFYIRRDLSMHVPTHRVSLAFQTFHGLDELRATSPGLVDFLLSTYRSTLAAHASKRGGYHVCEWEAFTCFAFRSPSAALAFTAACHVELAHFDWPDTIVHCKAFAPEYAKPDDVAAPPTATPAGRRLGGDEELKRGPLVFNGPRLHSYISFGNPCCEIDTKTGRLLYFGHDINIAVSALAYLVRPGEICANMDWGEALVAETQPTPPVPAASNVSVLKETPAASIVFVTESAAPPTPLAGSPAGTAPLPPRGSTFLGASTLNGEQAVLLRGSSNLGTTLRDSKDNVVLDVLRPYGYQCSEVRRGFPRINVITQTEPTQRGAYSRSMPSLPSWFHIPELISIVPDALAARRKHSLPSKAEPSWLTTSLGSTDALMTFVLLSNRSLNGRACGPGSISDEMKLWVAKAVRLSVAQAAASPALHTLTQPHSTPHHHHAQSTVGRPSSSEVTTLVSPSAAQTTLGSTGAAGGGPSPSKHQRRSVQSDGARQRAPSVHAALDSTEHGGGVAQPRTRRASKSNAHIETSTQQANANHGASSANMSQQHLLASPASSNGHLAPPVISIPFPPLLDIAPRGSTMTVTRSESKRFFSSYVFQRQAQAFELAAMEREDAFLFAKHQPLTPLHPPTAFVAVDVANLRSFEGSNDVAVARFVAPFQKMLRIAADLHHAFLVGTNNEDVHVYAFRAVEEALRFTATIQLKFFKDGFIDYLAPSWTPVGPLNLDTTPSASTPSVPFAAIVNLRCGISYGIPAVVSTRVSPAIANDGLQDVPAQLVETDCSGIVVRKCGYLCAAAAPGEVLATNLVVKAFYGASKKNLTSLDLTMVHKGLRILEGNAGCPMSIYTVQNTALVRSSQIFNARQGRSGSRHQSVLSIGTNNSSAPQGSPTSLNINAQGGGGAATVGSHNSQWFGDVRAPVQVGSMLFDVTSVSSIVFQPAAGGGAAVVSPQQTPLVETAASVDLDKIMNVADANRRHVFPLFTAHAGHQRLLRRSVAAMYRQQMAECALMSMHDPLASDSGFQSAPSARGELAVLYTDIEGSAKLLEASGETFVRGQQHFNWIVRELAHQYEGYVTHTNGYEAWLIVFPGLRQAMEAAIAIQQQLVSVEWSGDLVKHERALRVRDPKSGMLIFNGLRARVGIAVGALSQQQSSGFTQRFDYVGSVVDDAVRVGRSAPGGDIWMTPDAIRSLEALNGHTNPVIAGAHRRLTAQLRLRPILQPTPEDANAPLAVSCVLRTMESRSAKFPPLTSILDRFNRVSSSMEKDLGTWWRQAATVGMRNEAIRIIISKKKSMTGSTMLGAMGATLGVNADSTVRSPSMAAAASGTTPAVAMLLDRLVRIERQLPPSGGSNSGSGSTTPRGKPVQPQAAASGGSAVTVPALCQVIRGAIGCLRGGADMMGAIKMLEDASRVLGAVDSFESKTPPPNTLKPSPPPPTRSPAGAQRGRGGRK